MIFSKNFFKFLGILSLGFGVFVADTYYPDLILLKISYTLFLLAGVYLLTNVLIESYIKNNILDERTRYSMRKSLFFGSSVLFLIVFIGIWVENIQTLMVAYGIIGAGVAISLQDFFKNIVGGIMIFTRRPYTIGDRIEIDGKYGDVLDIGLLSTSLVEMREWVNADQATGRLSDVPNGLLLSKTINNYTKDYNFLWDEIALPITYDSDWKKVEELIYDTVNLTTKEYQESANNYLDKIGKKYYIEERDTVPSIYIDLTDNWVNFTVRYVCPVHRRREVADKISHNLLEIFSKEKDIKVASSTVTVTNA